MVLLLLLFVAYLQFATRSFKKVMGTKWWHFRHSSWIYTIIPLWDTNMNNNNLHHLLQNHISINILLKRTNENFPYKGLKSGKTDGVIMRNYPQISSVG